MVAGANGGQMKLIADVAGESGTVTAATPAPRVVAEIVLGGARRGRTATSVHPGAVNVNRYVTTIMEDIPAVATMDTDWTVNTSVKVCLYIIEWCTVNF